MGIKDLTLKAVDSGFMVCYEKSKKPSGHSKMSYDNYEYMKEAFGAEAMGEAYERFMELHSMVENAATMQDENTPAKEFY